MASQRKLVEGAELELEFWVLDGLEPEEGLAKWLEQINEFKATHQEVEEFKIKVADHWDEVEVRIVTQRRETDKEYEARRKREMKAAQKVLAAKEKKLAKIQEDVATLEKAERMEYERLRAKFGV